MHSTVLVIGLDPEAQLAPFNETIQVDPYWKETSLKPDRISDEVRRAAQETGLPQEFAPYETYDDEEEPYRLQPDGRVEYRTTYNPESKWDWYSLGGRWTGYFRLKPGAEGEAGRPGLMTSAAPARHVDQCLWAAIDREATEAIAAKKAEDQYTEWEVAIAKQAGVRFIHWKALIARVQDEADAMTIDAARAIYRAQPAVAAMRGWMGLDGFDCDRATYIARAQRGALVPFAILREGTWYESGDMGTFGMIADEKDPDGWAKWVHDEVFAMLAADTLVSLYDVHI